MGFVLCYIVCERRSWGENIVVNFELFLLVLEVGVFGLVGFYFIWFGVRCFWKREYSEFIVGIWRFFYLITLMIFIAKFFFKFGESV